MHASPKELMTKDIPTMNGLEAQASSSTTKSSVQDSMSLLAGRCRREMSQKIDATDGQGTPPFLRLGCDFLVHPFRQQNHESVPIGDASRELLKLLAPLLQDQLAFGHIAIDKGEPIAFGMECSLRTLIQNSKWPSGLVRGMILHSLLPLYLHSTSGPKKTTSPFVESVGLLRDYLAIHFLDQAVENDIGSWLNEKAASWDASSTSLHRLGIDLTYFSSSLWNRPLLTNSQASGGNTSPDPSFSMSDSRRQALWSIVKQWLANSSHISLPKELAIERISWQTIRNHFQTLIELLEKPFVELRSSKSIDTKMGIEIAQGAIPVLDSCFEAVSDVLVGQTSQPQPEKGSKSKKEDRNRKVFEPIQDNRVVEIRSSSDPKLVRSLDQQLSDCRARQGSIALVIARTLVRETEAQPEGQLAVWQKAFVAYLQKNSEAEELRGFITPEGEISVLLEDIDRPDAAALVRDALQEAITSHRKACGFGADANLSLIAGFSFVSSPARSFKIQQLIDSGWRCLDGATAQGSGSVKSIEVY